MDTPATLAYYAGKLGFACLGTWQDPPVYAIVARDQQVIHFRCAQPPTANPDKYQDELLDAYLFVVEAGLQPGSFLPALFRLLQRSRPSRADFALTTSINPSNIRARYSSVLECGSPAPAFSFGRDPIIARRKALSLPGHDRKQSSRSCTILVQRNPFRINTYGGHRSVHSKQLKTL